MTFAEKEIALGITHEADLAQSVWFLSHHFSQVTSKPGYHYEVNQSRFGHENEARYWKQLCRMTIEGPALAQSAYWGMVIIKFQSVSPTLNK